MPWLTGDTPSGDCTITMDIPDDEDIRRACRGALSQLIYAHNWEQQGTATPDEIALVMNDALETFDWSCE